LNRLYYDKSNAFASTMLVVNLTRENMTEYSPGIGWMGWIVGRMGLFVKASIR
jgi:hypothetical protein